MRPQIMRPHQHLPNRLFIRTNIIQPEAPEPSYFSTYRRLDHRLDDHPRISVGLTGNDTDIQSFMRLVAPSYSNSHGAVEQRVVRNNTEFVLINLSYRESEDLPTRCSEVGFINCFLSFDNGAENIPGLASHVSPEQLAPYNSYQLDYGDNSRELRISLDPVSTADDVVERTQFNHPALSNAAEMILMQALFTTLRPAGAPAQVITPAETSSSSFFDPAPNSGSNTAPGLNSQ
jgi:hypothetical protein